VLPQCTHNLSEQGLLHYLHHSYRPRVYPKTTLLSTHPMSSPQTTSQQQVTATHNYHSAHLPIISTNHLKFPLSSAILLFQSLEPQDIEEDLVHHIVRGQFQFGNSPWWNLCMGRWKKHRKFDMQEKRTWSDVDICGNGGYVLTQVLTQMPTHVLTQVLTHMDTLTKYRLPCVYKGPCPEWNP